MTWLFPLAAIGLLAGRPRPRLDDPRHQAVLFWAIWFACGVIVFSFAHGMFRPYYVVMLAPALAALVGIGLAALWRSYREPGWPSALLPAALLTTAAWQGYVLREYRDWGPILTAIAVGGGLVAALGLLLLWIWLAAPLSPRWPQAALARGLIALMASPAAWAVTPALVGTASGVPAAGPELLTRGLGPGPGGFAAREADVRRLVDFLRAHRHGERYLLATANAMQASPIIVQTGEPVMAIGGWSGGDPILTQAQFAGLVVEGHVRYVLVPEPGGRPGPAGAVGPWGGGRPTGPANGSDDGSDGGRNGPLFRWVVEHGRRVDPTLWQAEVPAGESDRAMPRAVYDCRPDATEAASKQEGSE